MGRGPASQARRNARKVQCPTCGQAVGDDCFEVTGPHAGKWRGEPHPDRLALEYQLAQEKRRGVQAE